MRFILVTAFSQLVSDRQTLNTFLLQLGDLVVIQISRHYTVISLVFICLTCSYYPEKENEYVMFTALSRRETLLMWALRIAVECTT